MTAQPLTLSAVEQRIRSGEIELITCDVFDTLVWRPMVRPVDLFPTMRDELVDLGLLDSSVDATTFQRARVGAEERARADVWEQRSSRECTIEEIHSRLWKAMRRGHPNTDRDADVETGVRCELDVERRTLRPHRGVRELLGIARDHAVRVELVSDTYLSEQQLRELLTAVGLDLSGFAVTTSSSRGFGKGDGLLADVVERSNVAPPRIVHVGDNHLADVEAALAIGVGALDVGFHPQAKPWSAVRTCWGDVSRASGTDHGVSAAARATVVEAGEHGRSASFRFGAMVAGPLLAGFGGWVGATAEQLGAGHIHCLLREGATIAELVRRVRPSSPPTSVVHASRWVYTRAAVVDGTLVELERALARRQRLDAAHVAAAFGLPLEDVAAVLGSAPIAHFEQLDALAAIAESDLVQRIVESSAEIRSRLVRYLDRALELGDGPLVLADVGWGGTIQMSLDTILAAEGRPVETVGLYAMLSTTGERRVGEGCRMLSYLPAPNDPDAGNFTEVVARHPEFLERIATPGIGTLTDVAGDGTPLTAPAELRPASLLAAQRGVSEFAAVIAGQSTPEAIDAWVADRAAAVASQRVLAAVLLDPSPELADEVGHWDHDDVAGAGPEPLVGSEFPRWVPYMSGVDAAKVPMWEVYWVAGAAALRSPAVAAELRAATLGLLAESDVPVLAEGRGLLAAFAPGELDATLQARSTGRTAPGGWSLVRIEGDLDGLRCLRFDPAELGCVGEIADAELELVLAGGGVYTVQGPAAVRGGTWLGGRWIDDARFECTTGGHLLVVPPDVGDVRRMRCTLAWRTWPGEISGPWRRRVDATWNKARRGLNRLADGARLRA
jgi:FMN phosphatase YigB (HAD superfamily)